MKKSCDNAAARVVARYKLANCNVWKYTDNLQKDALGKVHNFSIGMRMRWQTPKRASPTSSPTSTASPKRWKFSPSR